MTQDMRQPSPSGLGAASEPARAPAQRLVLGAVQASALVFLAAGLYMLFGQPEFLPADTARIVAVAFIVTAVVDLLAVGLLRKVWSRQQRRVQ